jgi:hypothetical protein
MQARRINAPLKIAQPDGPCPDAIVRYTAHRAVRVQAGSADRPTGPGNAAMQESFDDPSSQDVGIPIGVGPAAGFGDECEVDTADPLGVDLGVD